MDLIKSLSFPPTFLRWQGVHGDGMVVVPPPVIAFDWLLPGVAWRGLVVPHYRLLPSASLAIFHGGMAGYSFLPLSGARASALAGNSLLMPMESDTSYNKAEWAISA
jgi:hypothetical protein